MKRGLVEMIATVDVGVSADEAFDHVEVMPSPFGCHVKRRVSVVVLCMHTRVRIDEEFGHCSGHFGR